MFRKVLIANRGEIAIRVIRTCREMGISTVAVYSDADANAPHVWAADEAYRIGPPPATESYLSIPAILDAARVSDADAVHPGYGFLSENPEFARAVIGAGLAWIGPAPEVIASLGDKVAAKEIARGAGVPVVPGYDGPDFSVERMTEEAERIGYPVMLKAAAGGGGKGMRAVQSSQDLPAALEGASREARAAFGDGRIFIEKLLIEPRHVEIQMLADQHGAVLYLGERDCSIQRRHQKVVEEAPSPVITPELRQAMGEAAVRLARAAGYVNAGTVEFLFAGDQFYFLEVNTRIQVEHPVTEMVTGLDLIRLQLEIAAGEPLRLMQPDIELRGHAIEVRVYAEDPYQGFVPATGTIETYEPPEGPGIRVDSGVVQGSEITPYYDPMLAKLIVHASDRNQAVARLRDALSRYVALGTTTNLSFLTWIAGERDFVRGNVDTGWLDRTWRPEPTRTVPIEVLIAAALAETVLRQPVHGPGGDAFSPWRAGGWRTAGVSRDVQLMVGGEEYTISLRTAGARTWEVTAGEESRKVALERGEDNRFLLRIGASSRPFAVVWRGGNVSIELAGEIYHIRTAGRTGDRGDAGHAGAGDLTTPMPGTVVKVAVSAGDRVAAHQPLVVLEAMKMEHVVEAPQDGVVDEVLVREGEMVSAGSPVARMSQA